MKFNLMQCLRCKNADMEIRRKLDAYMLWQSKNQHAVLNVTV